MIDEVLLEHVGLTHVLPLTVHLDLEHLPNTQGYLGLLSAWECAIGCIVVCKRLYGSVQAAAWSCASGCTVVCKWRHGCVQVVGL